MLGVPIPDRIKGRLGRPHKITQERIEPEAEDAAAVHGGRPHASLWRRERPAPCAWTSLRAMVRDYFLLCGATPPVTQASLNPPMSEHDSKGGAAQAAPAERFRETYEAISSARSRR